MELTLTCNYREIPIVIKLFHSRDHLEKFLDHDPSDSELRDRLALLNAELARWIPVQ